MSPEDYLILGELADTLPPAIERFRNKVALVHTDIGSADIAYGMETAAFIARQLPPALVPGAVVLSDQDLSISGAAPVVLPPGVAERRYFMYRAGSAAADPSTAPTAA